MSFIKGTTIDPMEKYYKSTYSAVPNLTPVEIVRKELESLTIRIRGVTFTEDEAKEVYRALQLFVSILDAGTRK